MMDIKILMEKCTINKSIYSTNKENNNKVIVNRQTMKNGMKELSSFDIMERDMGLQWGKGIIIKKNIMI